jgi:glycosyltransferase involved in cell wall biosynthesis
MFGTLPPPVGGVTKSVENLYYSLNKLDFKIDFFSMRNFFILKKYDVAHSHYSKSWKRFLAVIIGKLFAKKTILTLHGSWIKGDFLDILSFKFADGVIFLNKDTAIKYKKYVKNTKFILLTSLLSEGLGCGGNSQVYKFNRMSNQKYALVYAYNNVSQDSMDIYGVDFVVNNMAHMINAGYDLVLLDPKGAYSKYGMRANIVYINKIVDVYSLLKDIDLYIRPTLQDGDSVLVREALSLGVPVLASNVVERPQGVKVYETLNVQSFIESLIDENLPKPTKTPLDSVKKYISFCESL